MNKAALQFSRLFVGILFIFSGLIKANDTLGFGYKLEEYFDVFHLSFLSPFATGMAMFLCVLEIALGALLLFGFWGKKVAAGLLGIIIFFTFLTFVSAAFKVVTSCGCFGDAIPLTPWQSFSKDLVLLLLIVYLFANRERILPVTTNPSLQKAGLIAVIAASFLFTIYTYTYLPVVDFLPYKKGVSLPAAMSIPPGAVPDEFQIMYTLKNKGNGATKEMSDKEYLKSGIWKDKSWEIVGEPTQKLLKKGYEPKIKDLVISDASGTNYTKELLENPYYNLIIVSYNLGQTNEKAIGNLNALTLDLSEQYNVRTVLLTSSSAQDAALFSKRNKLLAEVFYADAVPLKSMVRASPGILLLKDGVVVNKWSYHGMPSLNQLKAQYFDK